MPTKVWQGSPYPRRGLLLYLRTLLLWGWGILIPYLLNAMANIYRLNHSGESSSLSTVQILLALFRPVVFSGSGDSISAWVVAIFFLPLPLILVAYLWAKRDQTLENEVSVQSTMIKEGEKLREEATATITETLEVQMTRYIDAERRVIRAVPVKSLRVWGSDLPRIGRLIGREAQLAQIMAWLRASQDVAVVAVQGLPSVGKTVLAAEAVAQLVEDEELFPGGAAWISCDNLQGQEGLAQLWTRIARALAARDITALPDRTDRRAALHAMLADSSSPRLLLALDNVEAGLDMRTVLDTISGGRATLLLTSRQTIVPDRVQRLPLEPLPNPEATRLFVQRLMQADPHRPGVDESLATDELVPMLGGLPLAIELAASYAGLQERSLNAVAEEIRRDGLVSGPLQELSAHFDRSWRVLSISQQRLFAGLSELAGPSFPREAALAVAQAANRLEGGHVASDLQRTVGDLSALIGSSLLEPVPGDRLRLHPLLREYAEGRLDNMPSSVSSALGTAVLEYWLQFVQQHHGAHNMDDLEAEAAALMGTLQWAHLHDRREGMLELVRTLSDVWGMRSRDEELQQMLEWAISAAEGVHDETAECEMTLKLARLQVKVGQPQLALINFEAVDTKAERLGASELRVAALRGLAAEDRKLTKDMSARWRLQRALDLTTEQTHNRSDERAILHELAVLDLEGQRFPEALAEFNAALTVAQAMSDSELIALEQRSIARLRAEHPEIKLR